MSIGMEVWELVEEGYDVPKIYPTEKEDMKKYWEHEKSLNTLQYHYILSNLNKKIVK